MKKYLAIAIFSTFAVASVLLFLEAHAAGERWFGGWFGGIAAFGFIVIALPALALLAGIVTAVFDRNKRFKSAAGAFILALVIMVGEMSIYLSFNRMIEQMRLPPLTGQQLALLDPRRPVTIMTWIGTGVPPAFEKGKPIDIAACVADESALAAGRIRAYIWGNVPGSTERVTLADGSLPLSGKLCADGRKEFTGDLIIADPERVHPRSIMLVVGEGENADSKMLEERKP